MDRRFRDRDHRDYRNRSRDRSRSRDRDRDRNRNRDRSRDRSNRDRTRDRSRASSVLGPGPNKSGPPPSRHLWVGNLAQSITEGTLLDAFIGFGEVQSINHMPGRSYAFVNFKRVEDAIDAMRSMQGTSIEGTSVKIEFSKGDMEPSDVLWIGFPATLNIDENTLRKEFSSFGEIIRVATFSGRSYAFVHFRHVSSAIRAKETLNGRLFDNPRVSISYAKNDAAGNPNPNTEVSHDRAALRDFDSPVHHRHPDPYFDRSNFDLVRRERIRNERIRNYSPFDEGYNGNLPRNVPLYDNDPYPLSKRIRTERDLPEYPFYEFPHVRASDANMGKLRGLSEKEVWKWEGMIMKGGTSVCRARCFPVGKTLDFMLPETLHCTARTSLEMLSKHYYQAAGSWVVFFVPDSDSEITSYNDFMHYLGEKQRVAVVKLDDKISLFLIPPSEFTKKVLKVAGTMSISGLVLKFHQNTDPDPNIEESAVFKAHGSPFLNYGSSSFANQQKQEDCNVSSYKPLENNDFPPGFKFRPELPPQNYAPNPSVSQNYAPNPSVPLQNYAPNPPLSQNYAPEPSLPPQNYAANPSLIQNYAPNALQNYAPEPSVQQNNLFAHQTQLGVYEPGPVANPNPIGNTGSLPPYTFFNPNINPNPSINPNLNNVNPNLNPISNMNPNLSNMNPNQIGNSNPNPYASSHAGYETGPTAEVPKLNPIGNIPSFPNPQLPPFTPPSSSYAPQNAPAVVWGPQASQGQNVPAVTWAPQASQGQNTPAVTWGQQASQGQNTPAVTWAPQGTQGQNVPAVTWDPQGTQGQNAPTLNLGPQVSQSQNSTAVSWGPQVSQGVGGTITTQQQQAGANGSEGDKGGEPEPQKRLQATLQLAAVLLQQIQQQQQANPGERR